jgi:uncharacterized BrkB/YihY/UPF0761 family membrane protein
MNYISSTPYDTLVDEMSSFDVLKIFNQSMKQSLLNFSEEFLNCITTQQEQSGNTLGVTAALFISKATSLF